MKKANIMYRVSVVSRAFEEFRISISETLEDTRAGIEAIRGELSAAFERIEDLERENRRHRATDEYVKVQKPSKPAQEYVLLYHRKNLWMAEKGDATSLLSEAKRFTEGEVIKYGLGKNNPDHCTILRVGRPQ